MIFLNVNCLAVCAVHTLAPTHYEIICFSDAASQVGLHWLVLLYSVRIYHTRYKFLLYAPIACSTTVQTLADMDLFIFSQNLHQMAVDVCRIGRILHTNTQIPMFVHCYYTI